MDIIFVLVAGSVGILAILSVPVRIFLHDRKKSRLDVDGVPLSLREWRPGEIGRNPPPSTPSPTTPPSQGMHDEDTPEDRLVAWWNMLQKEVWQTSEDHGWHERPLNDGEAIALMHSELSEALEALRHDNPPDDHVPAFSGAEAELADVVIRIMHYAQRKGFRVAEAVIAKAEYNKARPYKHGNKKF